MNSYKDSSKKLNRLKKRIYEYFLAPRSKNEDIKRREYIFTVLLIGAIALTTSAFVSMLVNLITEGNRYDGLSPIILLIPSILLSMMYIATRKKFINLYPYIFLSVFTLLGTYALYVYGYVLPEGLLTYALVVVMAGILISDRAAALAIGVIVICLSLLAYIQSTGITQPDTSELLDPLNPADIFVYIFIFTVIFLVTWISNHDLEKSLNRARQSEAALMKERNSLEAKVRRRTKELEQAQVEKMMELHRFAEFGRFSSTLLHELANPLTSVSLDLEQIHSKKHAQAIKQARQGISYMEEYVNSARRQLRNQSELKKFDAIEEIRRVIEFLKPKVARSNIKLTSECEDSVMLYGDSIRFDQIFANLIANAIDACASKRGEGRIQVSAKVADNVLFITVVDNGIGIASSDVKKIFEPFFTTKNSDRGTGLGLAITKRAVEEDFSGTITATSSKRTGTKFIVTVPVYAV
jgi:signal transduction histidine kinase